MSTEMATWAASMAGRIVFGRGASQLTGIHAGRLGDRVLICTDGQLVDAGVVATVVDAVLATGLTVEVFEGGVPDVSVEVVEAGVQAAAKARATVVIGVGGGSNIDLAKGVALICAHGGDVADYYGESKVPGATIPVIAIPTTAGTGSEVSPVAVFSDDRVHLKVGVSSPHMNPAVAIVDPLLTVSCPPRVTAHSGLDALSHAIEATCAISYRDLPADEQASRVFTGKNPYADGLAAQAIRLVGGFLKLAVDDGTDLEAREAMATASLLAGLAFSSAGTGLVHALQYPIGSLTRTSHGHGNAVLMPAVMQFNLEVRQAEMAMIARALGAARDAEADDAAAVRAPGAVAALAASVGVPAGLGTIGVLPEHVPAVAAEAMTIERLIRANPRPVTAGDLEGILDLALTSPKGIE